MFWSVRTVIKADPPSATLIVAQLPAWIAREEEICG